MRFYLAEIITRKLIPKNNKHVEITELEVKFKRIKAAFENEKDKKKFGYKMLEEDINLTIIFWKKLIEGYSKKKNYLKSFEVVNNIMEFIKLCYFMLKEI